MHWAFSKDNIYTQNMYEKDTANVTYVYYRVCSEPSNEKGDEQIHCTSLFMFSTTCLAQFDELAHTPYARAKLPEGFYGYYTEETWWNLLKSGIKI
jgi:hypothetical protein